VQRFKRLSDIGMLGATVAHELRNPLGVIRTAVFNIQRKRTNTGIDRHLDNIEKKIVESDQIINNLLFYARLKKPVFEPMNLSTAMKESTAAVKDRFSESRVSVRTINRLGARFMIDADDYQLREVFTNLLNNAFQAIGGEKGRVEITLARSRKEGVTIRVRDTGCGIVPEDREKVFDPFFTRKSKGTGLGLSLCRDVIEMHGGRIALQSKPGEGTAVTVVLPAENAARGASSSRKKSAGTGGGESVAGEKRPSRVTPSRRKKSRKKDAS
jgi:signal transduction histidine kinase